jgi:glycogen operon protein
MQLRPGHTRSLGAVASAQGVNFALAAPNAQAVELCLFSADGQQELQRLAMPAREHGIWHGLLEGAQPGLTYGYRVHGPWDPLRGQRFNPAKLLLDPCARDVVGSYGGQDVHVAHLADDLLQPDPRDNATLALKARVVTELPPVARPAPVDSGRRVIYELHVKGFTALHPLIPPALRGSYAGLGHPAAIAHLVGLGITTVCIMPVAFRADEVRLQKLGLSNYWGYSPIAWNAPETRYWSASPGSSPRTELRAMVDALHAAGLEVVLDVVYNHTGETDALGPTLSMRGIDNAMYYHLDPAQPEAYMNWTGCGNCVNLNHPLVLRTVMDSLRGWVSEFGVDGFRFDLATVLARGTPEAQFSYSAQAPFLMAVAQDPVLRETLLIAEPWDIGSGGYQLGQFPAQWLEWNDKFRDVQRSSWLHRDAPLGALAQRLAGSADCFDPQQRSPVSSVNFVTAHDGFTLTDLVSYAQRHNEANGENNRDGHGHNLSVNNGVEGPTHDPQILAQRAMQKRALVAVTLLSLGTPMLLAGDEIGHTQHGNNNAYCQDNATTWLNWEQADTSLQQFVSGLLALRRKRRWLQSHNWWSPPEAATAPVAQWFAPDGQPMHAALWHQPQVQALMLLLGASHSSAADRHSAPAATAGSAGAVEPDCLLLLNLSTHAQQFSLPAGTWICHLNTSSGEIGNAPLDARATVTAASLWLASKAVLAVAAPGPDSPPQKVRNVP